MPDMSVEIAGVKFKNPVIAASGTFGFGQEYGAFYNIRELGGISVKGLTLKPRAGNPPPRVAETPSGMLNSVGLQNPGVEAFIRDELPRLSRAGLVVIANAAGSTVEEYCEMADRLSDSAVDMIELNISCPNVKEGGVAFGVSPITVSKVTGEVKKRCKKPLIVKLSPNVADIGEIASAAESAGADALSLINTLLGMAIDITTGRPILKNNAGGLSGPAVKPVAVRMVWQAAQRVKIPLIGMGGISVWQDAVEMLMAGASAVMVGTACFRDPYAPLKIRDGIEKYMLDKGIEGIGCITGSVKPWN